MTAPNPVLVDVVRGNFVESRHRGACAVVNVHGDLVHGWGNVDALVYPRSALKPVQALSLLESGAADHFALTDEEIALACASHNGEPFHVERVNAWLHRVGLSGDDLECGIGESISLQVTKAMSRDHIEFTRAHNNCSGKHAGFLCTARHLGVVGKNYLHSDHPVQRQVTESIEQMAGVSLENAPRGVDGCGIPVFAFPLRALARAMARMMATDLAAPRRRAAERILAAMAAHPHCVAGHERFDTVVMEACGGAVVLKGGAEGVHVAMIPAHGLAVALKIDDGSIRGSELAMGCVLDGLGLLPGPARDAVAERITTPVLNTLGAVVGELRRGPGLVF